MVTKETRRRRVLMNELARIRKLPGYDAKEEIELLRTPGIGPLKAALFLSAKLTDAPLEPNVAAAIRNGLAYFKEWGYGDDFKWGEFISLRYASAHP